MDCMVGNQKWNLFIKEHFDGVRAPFSAGIELLADCNFKCVHCYAESNRRDKLKSLSTSRIFEIIDELVRHNCIEIYFTGGECLLHKDFIKIYLYAKKKGILVSVLTNGSLISKQHIDVWTEFPPELVSMTLYGASEETYEIVTGDGKGYKKIMEAIQQLKVAGIRYELKIIGMKQNYKDIPLMREYIRSCGQKNSILAWDIRPMNDGDKGCLTCRVSPEEVMEIEKQDVERRSFYYKMADSIEHIKQTDRQIGGYLYPCSAGKQFVFITHDGFMQSCVKAVKPRYNLADGNLAEGWKFIGDEYVEKKASDGFKCLKCSMFRYCGQCTAAFYSEMGHPETPVPFFCEVGRLRKEFMMKLLSEKRPE